MYTCAISTPEVAETMRIRSPPKTLPAPLPLLILPLPLLLALLPLSLLLLLCKQPDYHLYTDDVSFTCRYRLRNVWLCNIPHTHTPAHTCAHTHPHIRTHTRTHTPAHTHPHTHALTYDHIRSHTITNTMSGREYKHII